MRVFAFVIHSHNCALCGILLYNGKQNKRQPTNAAKRISPPTKQQPIRFSFAVFFDRALQSYH